MNLGSLQCSFNVRNKDDHYCHRLNRLSELTIIFYRLIHDKGKSTRTSSTFRTSMDWPDVKSLALIYILYVSLGQYWNPPTGSVSLTQLQVHVSKLSHVSTIEISG